MTTTEKRRRPARLQNIQLSEISLVDRPANPAAKIVMFKRDDSADDEQEHTMDISKIAAFDSFEAAVEAIRKREGVTHTEAMSAAARAHPDLVRKFNEDGDVMVAKAAEAASPAPGSKAELAFNDRVEALAKREGIGRADAMSAARRRYPEEFAAAYPET